MNKIKEFIIVDGYNPFNRLNMILAAVSGCAFGIIFYGVSSGVSWDYSATIALIVAIVCFAILLFRNRKLKSIPKAIIFSVVSSLLGIAVCLVGMVLFVIMAMLGGGNNSKFQKSASNLSNAINNASNSGNQWQEQYSMSKGTYYTDGQGNFKDQYGNDVYNPQGVTDYDKL